MARSSAAHCCPCSSMDRAAAYEAVSWRFESSRGYVYRAVAQLVAFSGRTRRVLGWVARFHPRGTGSNPVHATDPVSFNGSLCRSTAGGNRPTVVRVHAREPTEEPAVTETPLE